MLGRPFRQFRLKGLLTTMNELNKAKRDLAMMLVQSDKGLGVLLRTIDSPELVDGMLINIFDDIFPMACEILGEGYIRPSTAVLKCLGACGMSMSEAVSMIRCGMHSDNPLLTLEGNNIILTPNGRKNTIRAVRAIKRYALTEKIEVPELVNEVLESILKKTELELV